MNGADPCTPTPPAAVITAAQALRGSFEDLHVMHECDEKCDFDCDMNDQSPEAYREHDEHNFDTREDIERCADVLLGALEDWLGPLGAESLTWRDPNLAGTQSRSADGAGDIEHCDECGWPAEGISRKHGTACSMYPDNIHDAREVQH